MILIEIHESLLNDLGAEKHSLILKELLPLKLRLIKKMSDEEFEASKRCYESMKS